MPLRVAAYSVRFFIKLRNSMKEVLKKIARPAIRYIRYEILKRYINSILKRKGKIFLEVGAGDKKGINGWVTIDMTRNCDIYRDLTKGIPFPDESISGIYSSHFLEHLSYNEGQKFLDECLRVLMPGGHFSICVPNARIYIEA